MAQITVEIAGQTPEKFTVVVCAADPVAPRPPTLAGASKQDGNDAEALC